MSRGDIFIGALKDDRARNRAIRKTAERINEIEAGLAMTPQPGASNFTDNAVVRANGTGGSLQDSFCILSDAGDMTIGGSGEVSCTLDNSVHTAQMAMDANGNYSVDATAKIIMGSGSPEGVFTAGIGSLFLRTDGGAGTALYVKESGTGNTGWVAK